MELKIPTVVRWYRYWQKKGGSLYHKENLCHFVRTVLFYAPARWFFFARTAKVVAPWSVTLLLTLLTSFWLWPKETAIGISALTVVVGIIALLAYNQNNIAESVANVVEQTSPFFTYKIVGRLPAWFFVVAMLIGLGLVLLPDLTLIALFIIFCVAVGLGILVGLIFGSICLDDHLKERQRANRPPYEEYGKPSKIREFLKVIGVCLLALKKGICPF